MVRREVGRGRQGIGTPACFPAVHRPAEKEKQQVKTRIVIYCNYSKREGGEIQIEVLQSKQIH